MLWVRLKRNVSMRRQNLRLIEKSPDITIILGLYMFMPTSLYFELLKIREKQHSSPLRICKILLYSKSNRIKVVIRANMLRFIAASPLYQIC